MPASLQIRELPSGIFVKVKQPGSLGKALASMLIGAIIVYAVVPVEKPAYRYIGWLIGGLIIANGISILRGTETALQVTAADFISSGHTPEEYAPAVIARADTYYLEYKGASGGGEFVELPEGLYVRHRSYEHSSKTCSTCVLPHIDRTQTEAIIQRIYRLFPDTEQPIPSESSDPYLVTLELNNAEKEKEAANARKVT